MAAGRVAPALHEEEPDQRLGSAQEHPARFARIALIEGQRRIVHIVHDQRRVHR